MHPHTTVFVVMTFFHNLFTAAWIGGLLAMVFTFMPSAKKVLGKGPELKQLTGLVQKRQSLVVSVSLVGLALTGLLLTKRSPTAGELFGFSTTYAALLSLKHILYLVMIVLAVLRTLFSRRQQPEALNADVNTAANAGRKGGQPQNNTAAILMLANAVAGVLVLLLSSVLAVISSVPAG